MLSIPDVHRQRFVLRKQRIGTDGNAAVRAVQGHPHGRSRRIVEHPQRRGGIVEDVAFGRHKRQRPPHRLFLLGHRLLLLPWLLLLLAGVARVARVALVARVGFIRDG